jgi:hypothetical protein
VNLPTDDTPNNSSPMLPFILTANPSPRQRTPIHPNSCETQCEFLGIALICRNPSRRTTRRVLSRTGMLRQPTTRGCLADAKSVDTRQKQLRVPRVAALAASSATQQPSPQRRAMQSASTS